MGPGLVVGLQPPLGQLPNLAQALEQMNVEHFLPVRAIEPLDIGVLVGLARLDPASPSFRIAKICCSVKRDRFIASSWCPDCARILSFQGVHQEGKLTPK